MFPKAGSSEAKNSLERVVTLAQEDRSQLLQAVARVLERVAADPHHASEISKEDFGAAPKSSGGVCFESVSGLLLCAHMQKRKTTN